MVGFSPSTVFVYCSPYSHTATGNQVTDWLAGEGEGAGRERVRIQHTHWWEESNTGDLTTLTRRGGRTSPIIIYYCKYHAGPLWLALHYRTPDTSTMFILCGPFGTNLELVPPKCPFYQKNPFKKSQYMSQFSIKENWVFMAEFISF